MIHIQKFTFNPYGENTFVLSDETQEAIIIDAGCFNPQEQETLIKYIENKNLKVTALVNTHCHVDHVFGVNFLKKHFQVPFKAHQAELFNFSDMFMAWIKMQGFHHFVAPEIDEFISEKDKIQFGNSSLDIRFTPGHSPGHLVFISQEQKFCINGDVLFRGSIGRTDLPGGHHEQLLEAIQSQMFTLPEDMTVYTGHGGETSIGYEKMYNPFF